MKNFITLLIFLIWSLTTIVLSCTILGLTITTEYKWIEMGENILNKIK